MSAVQDLGNSVSLLTFSRIATHSLVRLVAAAASWVSRPPLALNIIQNQLSAAVNLSRERMKRAIPSTHGMRYRSKDRDEPSNSTITDCPGQGMLVLDAHTKRYLTIQKLITTFFTLV